MIPIHKIKDIVESQIIRSELEKAGIKFIIRTFEDSAYNGIFIAQKGFGQVLTEEEDAERAKSIINNLLKT